MTYVMSDIHGCFEEYQQLLHEIDFSEDDRLYILGDFVDRGKAPIKVLQDMMNRPNVIHILGNHDFLMALVLKRLAVEITEDNVDEHLQLEDIELYQAWMQDGGETTCKQFLELSADERNDILEYLKDSSIYEVVGVEDREYVLVHAGIDNFQEEKDLEDYNIADFVTTRADYTRRYFKDKNRFLVTGHTPTVFIREDHQPLVYEQHGHIAIDCGCVFGGRLAAYCLDTGEIFYVNSEQQMRISDGGNVYGE